MTNNCIGTGAIAVLKPRPDSKPHDFTLIEVYGGSHLTLQNPSQLDNAAHNVSELNILGGDTNPLAPTVLTVEKFAGDDTGYFHIPPGCGVIMTEVT